MADYTKCWGVANASIVKVNGVAAANIVKVDGATKPAAASNTMTRLALGLNDGMASWAALDDVDTVTVWEDNVHRVHGVESWEPFDIAYGEDGSGGDLWCMIKTTSANTILHSTDSNFTNKGTWTEVTNVDHKMFTILWGNGVWIAAGVMTGHDRVWRSTDGSTWSEVDLSSITFDGDNVTALTSDGAGNWWFGCGSKIYKSTNDGQAWSEEATITVGSNGEIKDLVYTNSTVVVLYEYDDGSGTQEARAASAAASDTTDWSSGVHLSSGGNMHFSKTNRAAAGDGRVVFIDTGTTMAADVSGKTLTIQGTRQSLPDEGNANCIATDGDGTWWVGSDGGTSGADGGDICRSNDNGLSWSRTVHGIDEIGAGQRVESIATNQHLPL